MPASHTTKTTKVKAEATPYPRESSTSASATSSSHVAQDTETAKQKKKAKRTPRPYTVEHQAIFKELSLELLYEGLWAKVKADGRLADRGATGIKAHIKATFGKL